MLKEQCFWNSSGKLCWWKCGSGIVLIYLCWLNCIGENVGEKVLVGKHMGSALRLVLYWVSTFLCLGFFRVSAFWFRRLGEMLGEKES